MTTHKPSAAEKRSLIDITKLINAENNEIRKYQLAIRKHEAGIHSANAMILACTNAIRDLEERKAAMLARMGW